MISVYSKVVLPYDGSELSEKASMCNPNEQRRGFGTLRSPCTTLAIRSTFR